MDFDIPKLAELWILYNIVQEEKGNDSSEAKALFNEIEVVFDLEREYPEETWSLILEILSKTDLVHVLAVLAAGPLEDLLAFHGEKVIDRVEVEAKANPRFKNLLLGVWQRSTMSEELWKRVRGAAGWRREENQWVEVAKPRPPRELDNIKEIDISKLAGRWIQLHSAQHGMERESNEVGDPLEVLDVVYDLAGKHPEEAWTLILEISKRIDAENVLNLLASGPVEDLLQYHGEKLIERVEAEARANPRFKYLLGGICQRDMSKELWERVLLAAGWRWENDKWVEVK
jgi:hypothetical protein